MPDAVAPAAIEADNQQAFTAPKDELAEFITEMKGKISSDTTTRQQAFNRAKNNYQMYRGLIGRPLADLPYEGSSDIRYRLSTLYIRQTRSAFTNAVLNAPKMVRYTPKLGKKAVDQKLANDAADRHEAFADTLYRDIIQDFSNIVDFAFSKLAIDGRLVLKVIWAIETRLVTEERERQPLVDLLQQNQAAQYKQLIATSQKQQRAPTQTEIEGADLTKEQTEKIVADYLGWDDSTERYDERIASVLEQINGEQDFIEVIIDRVVQNGPCLEVTNYEDIIVPDDTTRIAQAEWIAHKLRFSRRALRAKSRKNGGPYRNVESLLDDEQAGGVSDSEQRQMDQTRRKAEGLQSPGENQDIFNVTELYCWVKRSWIKRFNKMTDTSPDLMVRAVITFSSPSPAESEPRVLRAIELPFRHGDWPFVDWFYNQTDKRFYENEGIVGLLWPLELEHNMARNAAINRTTLAMSPSGVYMEDCGWQPQAHRQLGQFQPIDKTDYIAAQGRPAGFIEYPQSLQTMPEYDANNAKAWACDVVGVPNMSSLSGYATAPTQEQVQQVVSPANMIQQHEIANWLERWGRVFDMVFKLNRQYLFLDGSEEIGFVNPENSEGQRLRKEDFEYDFIVMAGGDPAMESPVLLAQKRALVMQQYVQNPSLAPYGDLYEAWSSYVKHTLPFNEASAFVPPRDKAQQVNQTFMQMQAMSAAKLAEGKRPARNQKQLQLSNAFSNLRPR